MKQKGILIPTFLDSRMSMPNSNVIMPTVAYANPVVLYKNVKIDKYIIQNTYAISTILLSTLLTLIIFTL